MIRAILTVAVAATITTAAPAQATPQQDGMFLYALGEVGIEYGSAATAIIAGHEVCNALDNGLPLRQVVNVLETNTQLGQRGAVVFAAISIGAYCGHHGDALRPNDGGDSARKTGVIA